MSCHGACGIPGCVLLSSPVSVALLGYGRFGRAFADLCREANASVRAFDPYAPVPEVLHAGSLSELVVGAKFVVLAVPLEQFESALTALSAHLTPAQIVLDVGSVKVMPSEVMTRLFGSVQPWVATHPLFGPASLARGERPLRVVVCPNPAHPQAVTEVEEFFRSVGCQTVGLSAEVNDRQMALTHALTFFVAKGMLDVGVPTDSANAPPSFQGMARTIEAVRVDAGHLLPALHRFNPFAARARQDLLRALKGIDIALDARGPELQAKDAASLAIPDLGDLSPALRETRELIDELDQELLAVLARRAVLSKRAGASKAALGADVKDKAREARVLETRRGWAKDRGLDPDDIESIFEAILRFSRSIQG
jgi:prephenate dehydrogenase